ncbi:uncharacterized protein LOC126458344 [Schistocerca serialis cubense]|uniref:uncharacterized protein LOC126458344 n=1 Tax=Schistocerca serialis cubense TaxID=2023355 RepID=UPI00214ED017|nr:uncharacterized protein LOC126458344 [Schistocerca serialis cubense]
MLRHSIAAFLLLATCKGLKYPHYEQVFRDPATYDMLYSSASGPINETWYFNRRVNLTALVLPSQIVSYCQSGNQSAGSWAKSPYAEDLEVRVYESNQMSAAGRRLVAVGRYLGNATSGEELRVTLVAAAAADAKVNAYSSLQPQPPTMAAYNGTSGSPSYIVSVAFKNSGLYPWYLRRDLATLSPLTEINNEQGFVIGLAFVLV